MTPRSTSSNRRTLITGLAASTIVAAGLAVTSTSSAAPGDADYDTNLELIRDQTVRNRIYDDSPDRDTPQTDLVLEDNFGPRSDYLEFQGGRWAPAFPEDEGGQFRAECEFSHFAYDDPIVKPGQPGESHLHVFWGNTDVNAYSTYDSLIDSGSSTCAGQELNRTGYWAPAMIDEAGNARIPEWIGVYYKGYGLARDRAEVYPPEAAMVQMDNLSNITYLDGGVAPVSDDEINLEYAFNCGDNWRGQRAPGGRDFIPSCPGDAFVGGDAAAGRRVVLEMHVKFGNCWNGEDPSNPANWRTGLVGGWFGSDCDGWATFPNVEYIIAYPVDVDESTDGWYLSSDVEAGTGDLKGKAGETIHADWWGGWHPEVNQIWIDNCTTFVTDRPSGCGFGYLTDGGPDTENPLPGPALRRTEDFEGPVSVPGAQISAELCPGAPELGVAGVARCDAAPGTPSTTTPSTTTPSTTTPTTASPTTTIPSRDSIAVPGRIEAEEHVRYSDSTPTNIGGFGDSTSGVDLQRSRDVDRGISVGWTAPGEWLEYEIMADDQSTMDLSVRVASAVQPGRMSFTLDGRRVASVDIDFTGNWFQWETLTVESIDVPSGASTLRATFEADDESRGRSGINLNWLELKRSWPSATD